MIDMALDATLFAIHNLSRLRKYITIRKPADQEEGSRSYVGMD
jgi:hypothetical protein